jgi:hypothetical protein
MEPRAERWRVLAVCLALVVVPAAALAACSGKTSDDQFDCTNDVDHPHELACMGLYSEWSAKTLAKEAVPFTPQFRAWADGMDKLRWIALPPGTEIDKSDPNEWQFPIGTRLWKEFSLAGRRIETRFSMKRGDGTWLRTVYRWSRDGESAATELTAGERDVEGTGYEIPAQAACAMCHDGKKDGVLGYDAVGLSASGATFPGDARAAEALGWLHANCGTSCHNDSPRALARATGLSLRLDRPDGPIEATNAYRTAVNVASSFVPQEGAAHLRIQPGSADESVLFVRASYRGDTQGVQMPPIGSHKVDPEGLAKVRAWIDALPRAPQT